MKTLLFKLRTVTLVIVFLWAGQASFAQSPDKQTDPKAPLKGQALYKQMKIYDSKYGVLDQKPKSPGDRALDRWAYEFNKLKNPFSGLIPEGIRELELQFSRKIARGDAFQKSILSQKGNNKSFSYWENRGPYNVGGRTRALAIDANDEQIILAGGVSGGLWRTTDGGQTWRKVTKKSQSPSITCIVQDPRPSKNHIWYYGSGERFGNSASATGSLFTGTGVYKSVNGGRTWQLLNATNDNNPFSASPFDLINSIAINPTNGDVYVGTFDGVHRSQDGGQSFEEVLAGGFDNTTEVVITPSGRIYATIASDGDPNAGFFTSTDGDNWENITPSGFVPVYGRTLIAFDPSNERRVFFFTQNLSGGVPALLYRYDENGWTDLSVNLPSGLGNVGNINLQRGYNMLLKVHPTNPDLVFIGGTNLYRSTTGFTTKAGIGSWIGGYLPRINSNSFEIYTDHHPDQHEILFFSSNPDKVLSANDGGVFITEDITAENTGREPVDWISLNNGYLTTQPYDVSFDPSAGSDDLLAGFQDNGTWFTSSTDQRVPWVKEFGGDGGFSAIADGGKTRYVSSQRGNIYRYNLDEEGMLISETRVTPARASDFAFITPFILDPNNDNIMYLPAGDRIWRNNNLDELPIGSDALTTVNWVELSNTVSSTSITALDISTYPVANRLYYGTSEGQVFRMDQANLDNQTVLDISTDKGLPPGFVNDINVDPSDANRVIVTFSNYGIQSLFLTSDGGETWTNISGNLEENQDGTGNGPSVRSTAFFGSSQKYGGLFQPVFVATSTGLYYTFKLQGEKTKWRLENFVIGNAVTDEVKTRKDGFVALAVHGNGLFSARFPLLSPLPELRLSVASQLDDYSTFVNSTDTLIDISDLFVQSDSLPIDITVTNTNPDLVTATIEGNMLAIVYTPNSFGNVTIGLIANSAGEQVSTGFNIDVIELPIYEQTSPSASPLLFSWFSMELNALVQSADDFTVPTGSTWQFSRVLAFGELGGGLSPVDNATVVIYQDDQGKPGAEIYNSGEIIPIPNEDIGILNLLLPETVMLESGTYWLSVYPNFSSAFGLWVWRTQSFGLGQEAQIRDLGEVVFFPPDWTPASAFFGIPSDAKFQIFGQIDNAPNLNTSTPLSTNIDILTWPNPSSESFSFNLRGLDNGQKISLSVYDIYGAQIYQVSDVDTDQTHIWDASQASSGIYFVQIQGTTFNKRLTIIKK